MGNIEDNPIYKLVKDQIPKQVPEEIKRPSVTGLIWINLLVEYDMFGNVKIIRSFTKPAKESKIKGIIKPKKQEEEKIKLKKETEQEEETLFN